MPEAKTKDRMSTSDGVLNLSEHLGTKDADPSMFLMVVPNDSKPDNSSTNPAAVTETPLNLVMNTKHSNDNLRMKCTPVAATAKTPLPSPKIPTDISYPDSITVPTNHPNKLNYFPKTVSNFQGAPVAGHLLQRIGPFQYNSSSSCSSSPSSGSPLVALVNPTATSVIPHGLKPVFTAPNTIPSAETMNQIVYNSMPSAKANVTQHPPTSVILLRSPAPMSKSNNYQYIMSQAEKNGPMFQKSAPQAIFGNESGKFIPVATIVPNNASLVTNSQKTVTSVLPGEPVLSTNGSKRPGHNQRKHKSTAPCPVESNPKRQNFGWPWYQNMNSHSMILQPSSNENRNNKKMDPRFSASQPLNLTLQTVSDFTSKPSHNHNHLTNMMCKYSSGKSSHMPNLVFHSSTASPSPIIFNSAAYTLPNQNVYLPSPSHLNVHRGFSSHPAFANHMATFNPKPYPGVFSGSSIDLTKSKSYSSSPMRTQINEKNGHAIASREPPMTLKIDSIFSLADKPGTVPARPININQKPSQKIKVKKPSKLVCKDKKPVVQKPVKTLSKPRGRRPQKDAKPTVKKRPKPKFKRPNTSREINHSILARKAPVQKSDITVSCHANDFKSLHPMTEEERKLNTFFKYLGLCPSSSLTPNDSRNSNGVHTGTSANGRCSVSQELARCFSCYVVVPMFVEPDASTVVDVNNPPASLKILDKCSKECRHAFLNKQHATTGIVPRNGELDSNWKIIPQAQKCTHARKKYCRKSKTKASGNLTGSHCRRAGCIGCSTKKPTTPEKIRYFRKANKVKTVSSSVVTKEQTRKETHPQNGKKVYTFNKKSIDSKKEITGTDTTCINVLGEKNIPALRKKKANQDRQNNVKVVKKDVTEVENVMANGDVMESESVDEVSPLVSNFLDIEESSQNEACLMPVKKVIKPEPITLPEEDVSASSERIQRLREILKEKQKDLEIARQLLL